MSVFRQIHSILTLGLAVFVLAMAGTSSAQAQLFGGDDQARRAILDLRAKLDQHTQDVQQKLIDQQQRSSEDSALTRRQLLELTNQLDQLRRELATLRGDNERLQHELGIVKRQTDERLRPFEPNLVSMDGLEFQARPQESQAFDLAMGALRASQFVRAAELFAQMRERFPNSGYMGHVLYWEGNAHYAARQYEPAVQRFDRLIKAFPEHPKAPESLLSLASCYVELKDVRASRSALEKLVKDYPDTEAAMTARERLARLR
jgi:tol-pal system protein YbgF